MPITRSTELNTRKFRTKFIVCLIIEMADHFGLPVKEWVNLYSSENTLTDLRDIAWAMGTGVDAQILCAAASMRKMLSVMKNVPIQEVVSIGCIPYLLE